MRIFRGEHDARQLLTTEYGTPRCLTCPHATEPIQWGADRVFKVGGKLFAAAPLEVAPVRLSFKCTPENFAALCEQPGIIPAPYMARAQWVALETLSAVPESELRDLLEESYRLVWERLPKKRREALASARTAKTKAAGAAGKRKKPAKNTTKTPSGRRK